MGLSFNGTNSKLEWVGTSSPVTDYPVTIAMWVKPNATSMANTGILGGIGVQASLDGLEVYLAGADAGDPVYASSRAAGTGTFGAAALGATQGEWQLVMAYFGSQTLRSARVRSGSESVDTASNAPTFGAFRRIVFGERPTVDGGARFTGDIARIAIWTSDRRSDFSTLASGALPSSISPSTLLDYLELDTLASTYASAGTSGRTFTASNVTLSADHPAGGDTTPPTLSSPSGTGGLGVCSGSVSTNEGNGTLFAVATASTTQPSIAQIKAGQDHTGAAALRAVSQAVTATGTQTIASGAISGGAGTRYWHFVHIDTAANDSARLSSAGFEVTASATQLVLSVPDAAGLSGFNGIVLSAAAPGSGVTVIATPTGISFNGSGQATINVTGLGIPVGQRRWVSVTNSTGDPAQSPAPVQAQGPVTAS